MTDLVRSVACPRCKRIMPLDSLLRIDVLLTLEDDDGEKFPWLCPQCKYVADPADWTSNVFACGRTVQGTWRAMMAWRRDPKVCEQIEREKLEMSE